MMNAAHLHDGEPLPPLLLLVLHRPLECAVLHLDLLLVRPQHLNLLLQLLYPVFVSDLKMEIDGMTDRLIFTCWDMASCSVSVSLSDTRPSSSSRSATWSTVSKASSD